MTAVGSPIVTTTCKKKGGEGASSKTANTGGTEEKTAQF